MRDAANGYAPVVVTKRTILVVLAFVAFVAAAVVVVVVAVLVASTELVSSL